MTKDPAKARLIRNEQLVRDRNKTAKQAIKRYFQNSEEVQHAPIEFVCECSRLTCQDHIQTSIDQYEHYHEQRNHFMVLPDHAVASVDIVIAHQDGFDVVEKRKLDA